MRSKTNPQASKQFAENLRKRRKELGLTQERLADICGLHRTEIGLLEGRKRSPRLHTIVAIARGLELDSAGDLLDGIS
jgi:transcriptional regulator with XRE-family HTH domain